MGRWLAANGRERGAVLDLQQVWWLAVLWYGDPRGAHWQPRTPAESQGVLEAAGLTGEFWRLPGV